MLVNDLSNLPGPTLVACPNTVHTNEPHRQSRPTIGTGELPSAATQRDSLGVAGLTGRAIHHTAGGAKYSASGSCSSAVSHPKHSALHELAPIVIEACQLVGQIAALRLEIPWDVDPNLVVRLFYKANHDCFPRFFTVDAVASTIEVGIQVRQPQRKVAPVVQPAPKHSARQQWHRRSKARTALKPSTSRSNVPRHIHRQPAPFVDHHP